VDYHFTRLVVVAHGEAHHLGDSDTAPQIGALILKEAEGVLGNAESSRVAPAILIVFNYYAREEEDFISNMLLDSRGQL